MRDQRAPLPEWVSPPLPSNRWPCRRGGGRRRNPIRLFCAVLGAVAAAVSSIRSPKSRAS